ncbi:MAG: HK97 gp10 family phage protein [Brevundimonas sp.]|nr:MAG: HK97 gp10 family phage protein [Brevundimonas sp.]
MAQGSFSAQVSGWVRETKERREAVHKGSAQEIVSIMQTPRGGGGNLRVDTGFLRASLVAITGTALPAQTIKPDGGEAFSYDGAQINLVIAGADISQPLTFVYTANYARPREYGARGQPADRWVALAAQQWPQVVDRVCTEAKARSGG